VKIEGQITSGPPLRKLNRNWDGVTGCGDTCLKKMKRHWRSVKDDVTHKAPIGESVAKRIPYFNCDFINLKMNERIREPVNARKALISRRFLQRATLTGSGSAMGVWSIPWESSSKDVFPNPKRVASTTAVSPEKFQTRY